MKEGLAVATAHVAVEPLLTADRVSKSYRAAGWRVWRRQRILLDVSLEIHAGEIVALTGENGSGKSTLLRILAGVSRPDGGMVAHAGRIGYCPQDFSLFDELTPSETFDYFGLGYGLSARAIDDARSDLFDRFGLGAFRHTQVARLSEGTKQKLSLSVAIMHRPPLLLLDEPYAGLDHRTYLAFWDVMGEMASHGHSCLVVTHLMHERVRFPRVLRLAGGRCVAGV